MGRFLVCSDIHRRMENFIYALEDVSGEAFDGVIIAGDFEVDYSSIKELLSVYMINNNQLKLYAVKGNCDGRSNAPGLENMITFELSSKVKCLLTHGHNYQVKHDLDTLSYVADFQKADLVIYGHTHMYDNHVVGKTRFLNPGALCGGYDRPSYVVLEVEDDKIEIKRRII